MKKSIMLAAPLAALAACAQGGDADTDGDGEISSEEAAAEAAAANVNITPGQWENTVQFTEFNVPNMPEEMRGMMQEQMGQAQTSTSCITPEEAANPEANMFGDGDDDCSYTEFEMSGGNVRIAGTCDGGDMGATASISMQGTYTAESYDMTMSAEIEGGPMGAMSFAGRSTGRYVGPDCDAG